MINHFRSKEGRDIAFLELIGFKVDIEIGVLPTEVGRKQRVTIDAIIGFDDDRTHIEDNESSLCLNGFDSRLARSAIMSSVENRKYSLIETLANEISSKILNIPGAQCLELKISKDYLWADTSSTGIRIFREKC